MNSPLLYRWIEVITTQFPELGHWQRLTLALLSYGMVCAKRCTLSLAAQGLTGQADNSSLERRWQRWLANDRLLSAVFFPAWLRWISQLWGKAPLLLLIDETKLSDHLTVMMVGVAYHASALPLLWHAYRPEAYPEGGQVALMMALLTRLRASLPTGQALFLLADRGLGTSPEWQARLSDLDWDYLLRVQRSVLVRLPNQKPQPLRRLVGYGQRWSGRAQVFKNAGWQWKWVYLVWEVGYAEPWCLFSNQPLADPMAYGYRFHHESGFRDLKSDGLEWQRSRVWTPAHAERLLLALACASLWLLAEGTKALHLYPLSARQRRLSVFRLGLDYVTQQLRQQKQTYLDFYLAPDTSLLKSVVT